jgi:hypothetical protein
MQSIQMGKFESKEYEAGEGLLITITQEIIVPIIPPSREGLNRANECDNDIKPQDNPPPREETI